MTGQSTTLEEEQEEALIDGPEKPDLHDGLSYWNSIAQKEPTNNGVLGGFGDGSLPRVDAMGSRMFLLTIRPELSTIESPIKVGRDLPRKDSPSRRLYRALDVGAGIGRVTRDVLLYLFDRVDVVEPVCGFLEAARSNSTHGRWPQLSDSTPENSKKGVRFWETSIQSFDPSQAISQSSDLSPSIVGDQDGWNVGIGYDVIWAQWTLGHLSDEELVDFLKRCQRALRRPSLPGRLSNTGDQAGSQEEENHPLNSFDRHGGLIIVKENIYVSESDPDGDHFLFDQADSSLTRSHASFLRIFKQACLTLVKQDVQRGFDPDLYRVNFYALQ